LRTVIPWIRVSIMAVGLLIGARLVLGQDNGRPPGSYAPVDIHEAFSAVLARMSAAKSDFLRRQMTLLDERYDFRDDHEPDATTSRGKRIQRGVRVKLAQRTTWNQLADLTPEQIRNRGTFPAGFLPLPRPNHPEGGMHFPKTEIDELNNQVSRNPMRFDLDCQHDPRSPEVLLRESGRGIYLARAFMDELHVQAGPAGGSTASLIKSIRESNSHRNNAGLWNIEETGRKWWKCWKCWCCFFSHIEVKRSATSGEVRECAVRHGSRHHLSGGLSTRSSVAPWPADPR
jgi:hypothetical protein